MDAENKQIKNPFSQAPKSAYTPSSFLKTLRSYKGDVEEQIKNKNESVTSIAIKETSPERKLKPDLPINKPQGPSLLSHIRIGVAPIAIITLFLLGGVLLYGVYYLMTRPQAAIVVASTSIVPYTKEKDVNITSDNRTAITTGIAGLLQSTHEQPGSLTYMRFLKSGVELSAHDFFQALAPQASDSLARSFDIRYMSGVYSAIDNEAFVMLSTLDYGQTFAGMLAWEPSMSADLASIFPALSGLGQNTWNDDTFNNQDVRVLRDSSGKIVLVYGFLDKSILVITSDENTFQQIASKYINNKLVR